MRLLVKNGEIYDGTGAPPRKADILIEDGIILSIEPFLDETQISGAKIINASGQIVCPGFIDTHRHADAAVFNSPVFGKTELLQGITTIVCGNCGLSPVPGNHPWQKEHYSYIEPVVGPLTIKNSEKIFENHHQYRKNLESLSLPVNFGFLAGGGAIKTSIKGYSKQPFTKDEIARAKACIEEAVEAGALGLSFGLMYQSECYSGPDELYAMAKSADGTMLSVHIRGEGDSLVESVDEVNRLAEKTGLPVNISHFKSTGIKNWQNLVYRAVEKIEEARGTGLQITADFYPYDGGSTTILSLVPPSAMEDSIAALCAKLSAVSGRRQFAHEINRPHPGWDNMALSIGWDRIIISSVSLPEHKSYCGKSMETIAREKCLCDPAELLAELVYSEEGNTGIITLSMNQNDIDAIAALPWTCLISDSLYSKTTNPHPRLNGAFPKFLREYVKERHILSMENAVHKMTGMPAERMEIKNRGKIAAGFAADILVFNPDEFRDNADYSNSTALASGMGAIILSGQIVYNDKNFYEPNGRVIGRSG